MRGFAARVVGIAALSAAAGGCGPGKQLPDESLKGTIGPSPEAAVKVPAESDPDARRVVDRCLKASTGDHVTRVEKIKAFKTTARGTMVRPLPGDQRLPVDSVREVRTKWPNSCRIRLDSVALQPFEMGLRRPVIWIRVGTEFVQLPDPLHQEELAATDLVGQHWLLTLAPLTNPKTVAFDPATRTLGDKPADVVKVAVPGYTVFTLTVNHAGLLSQVDYEFVERGSNIIKKIVLGEHKSFDGVMLPTLVEYVRSGELVERWTISKWEFFDTMDDGVFDPPK